MSNHKSDHFRLKEQIPNILLVASLIFLGFAIGRLISLKADGKPSKQITQGILFEIVLGVANAFCLIDV